VNPSHFGWFAMAPIRSKDRQNEGSSTSNQGRIKSRKHHKKKDEDAPLGVSKIKSALRQTRRLLAKVRVGDRDICFVSHAYVH
jgi:hypothetical protein